MNPGTLSHRKRVLVIGAGGLVGLNFTRDFGEHFEIVGAGRVETESLEDLMAGQYDALVFLAQSSTYRQTPFQADLLNVNVGLVREVLERSVGRIPRVILFSSGSVYRASDRALDEDAPLDDQTDNPYVITKIASEMIARSFASYFDSVTIIRPFFIFGKEQRPEMLISRVAGKIRRGEPIEIGCDGGLAFNPIYVKDTSRAIANLISDAPAGLCYRNLFGPETVRFEEVVSLLSSAMGTPAKLRHTGDPLKPIIGASLHDLPEWAYGLNQALVETTGIAESCQITQSPGRIQKSPLEGTPA